MAVFRRRAAAPAAALALLGAACAAPMPPRPSSTESATVLPRAASASATPSGAAPSASDGPRLTSSALRAAVETDAMRAHLEALQAIADAHDGTRATGTPGFDATVAYVAQRLRDAGYEPGLRPVDAGGVPSTSVVAERSGGQEASVVMLGAHLDSVPGGPGLNDDGSGVAVLLVVAERLADLPMPARTVRIAFWGAEEGGPYGSTSYVAGLSAEERSRVVAYLNLDMLGSPNPLRLVYDEPRAAPGSEAITDLFAAYFDAAGLAWGPVDLNGDSDHGAFTDAGIPTGGLFSGGIEPVTEAEAAAFGAIAGRPADPCSHAPCDTLASVRLDALDVMADAVAHAVATLAGDGPR